ncbi:MAG: NAD(P)-binding domain-containing protein [Acidimicrobiales bacterium]
MHTDVTIIGAGQAGLAMSHCLTADGVDHVVLERGGTANAWRTERWDSLRLLTPNWMSRLPGFTYSGADPDGYMTAREVADHLESYRSSFGAPVHHEASVECITHARDRFRLRTSTGEITSAAVVIATGACGTPHIPAFAADFPTGTRHLAPIHYRNPSEVEGPVLVVGASASGSQIADELARAGHEVTLAVSNHVRLPRRYRGMDIHWWLERIGVLDERISEVEDPRKARRTPSLQLVGSPEGRDLGLNELRSAGVQIVGRLAGIAGTALQFSGSLANVVHSADLKQDRLLDRCDQHAAVAGISRELAAPSRPDRTLVDEPVLALPADRFRTVVWATGFRPDYPYLPVELLDAKGGLRHTEGVTDQAGLFVLGTVFNRRRNSSFIDGVGRDATELHAEIRAHLDGVAVAVPR